MQVAVQSDRQVRNYKKHHIGLALRRRGMGDRLYKGVSDDSEGVIRNVKVNEYEN